MELSTCPRGQPVARRDCRSVQRCNVTGTRLIAPASARTWPSRRTAFSLLSPAHQPEPWNGTSHDGPCHHQQRSGSATDSRRFGHRGCIGHGHIRPTNDSLGDRHNDLLAGHAGPPCRVLGLQPSHAHLGDELDKHDPPISHRTGVPAVTHGKPRTAHGPVPDETHPGFVTTHGPQFWRSSPTTDRREHRVQSSVLHVLAPSRCTASRPRMRMLAAEAG